MINDKISQAVDSVNKIKLEDGMDELDELDKKLHIVLLFVSFLVAISGSIAFTNLDVHGGLHGGFQSSFEILPNFILALFMGFTSFYVGHVGIKEYIDLKFKM